MNKSLLHLVGSSVLLYLIDDARSNKNHISAYFRVLDENAHIRAETSRQVKYDYEAKFCV